MGNGKIETDMLQALSTHLLRSGLLQHVLDGENRDLDLECGYPSEISPDQYRKMYDREGIGKRVVVCLPEESWAVDPKIYEDEDPSETEFEKAWKKLLEKYNLFHYLQRADELSGIGRFGVLLLGLDDGKELREPAEGLNVKGERTGDATHQLLFLRTFDESVLTVDEREKNLQNPRYGLPLKYTIRFQDEFGEASETLSEQVHWSRIIHVADGRKMSEVFGTPRMECVYNRLYDLRKILSGAGEMFWKGAFPGYSFEVNPEVADTGSTVDAESLREEFKNYSNGLQRYLALSGVTAKSLAPQVASPTSHMDAELRAIAISISIPHRVLFGSESGELASTQDSRAWNKRLARRQEKYLTPKLVRPFVDRLIAFGILPEPENYTVDWPDLSTPTEQDKASVAVTKSQALAQYVTGQVEQIIPPRTFLLQIMGMEREEVDAIMKEAEEFLEERREEQEQMGLPFGQPGTQPFQSKEGIPDPFGRQVSQDKPVVQ